MIGSGVDGASSSWTTGGGVLSAARPRRATRLGGVDMLLGQWALGQQRWGEMSETIRLGLVCPPTGALFLCLHVWTRWQTAEMLPCVFISSSPRFPADHARDGSGCPVAPPGLPDTPRIPVRAAAVVFLLRRCPPVAGRAVGVACAGAVTGPGPDGSISKKPKVMAPPYCMRSLQDMLQAVWPASGGMVVLYCMAEAVIDNRVDSKTWGRRQRAA